VAGQYEPFDNRWFRITYIVAGSMTTTFLLLTFVLWFLKRHEAAQSAAEYGPLPVAYWVVFGALSLASLPVALWVRSLLLRATGTFTSRYGQVLTGTMGAVGRISNAAVIGMAIPEVSILLGFVAGFLTMDWGVYAPFAAWGILGWAIMFPRPSQLRDWYERQGADAALPEMNVGGPA